MSILKDVSQPNLERFLERLNEPVKYKCHGICSNYDSGNSWRKKLLLECSEELGCFSGCNVYPIGGGEVDAMSQYHCGNNLWDKRTNYGKLRHSVLNLMKDKISKELLLRESGVK